MLQADLEQVRALWRDLTGEPDGFTETGPMVVGSDTHGVSRPGWIGIIELEGDVVVACPVDAVQRVRLMLLDARGDQLLEPDRVDELLHPTDTLGPALLFYGRPSTQARAAPRHVIGPIDISDPRVCAVLEDASQDEREESGIEETTSGTYVAFCDDGGPASVCAWRQWPHRIAHMSSLTAASHRASGFGLAAAVGALEAAIEQGFLPQWRAAQWNDASIALGHRLGLHLVGRQYSVTLASP